MYMPLWHQLMNQKPLFSISENYSQHCQTTLSWSKYYSLMSIGVNRSAFKSKKDLFLGNVENKKINRTSLHFLLIILEIEAVKLSMLTMMPTF